MTVEEFIHNCFRARTESLKLRLAVHQGFRERFYDSNCLFDSRKGVIDRSEGEKIVSVTPTDVGANVITTGDSARGSHYRVNKFGEAWIIHDVDYECVHHGIIDTRLCPRCGGGGWQSWKDRASMISPLRRKQDAALVTQQELSRQYFNDADVEEFMAEHVRERTVSRKKELEILSNYAQQFYGPECDWRRWGPYSDESDAETVLGIELVENGMRVITNGIHVMRLRYHLRPLGQSWLIENVATL